VVKDLAVVLVAGRLANPGRPNPLVLSLGLRGFCPGHPSSVVQDSRRAAMRRMILVFSLILNPSKLAFALS